MSGSYVLAANVRVWFYRHLIGSKQLVCAEGLVLAGRCEDTNEKPQPANRLGSIEPLACIAEGSAGSLRT